MQINKKGFQQNGWNPLNLLGRDGRITFGDPERGRYKTPQKATALRAAFFIFHLSPERAQLILENKKSRSILERPFVGYCRDGRIRTGGLTPPRRAL